MNTTSPYDVVDHFTENMNDYPSFNINSDMEKERLDVKHHRKIYANQFKKKKKN